MTRANRGLAESLRGEAFTVSTRRRAAEVWAALEAAEAGAPALLNLSFEDPEAGARALASAPADRVLWLYECDWAWERRGDPATRALWEAALAHPSPRKILQWRAVPDGAPGETA